MRRVGPHLGERHLVRAEGPFDGDAVDHLRPGPALRRAQDDERPARLCRGLLRVAPAARRGLDGGDRVEAGVERPAEGLVDAHRLVAFDEVHVVAVPGEEATELLVRFAPQHGGAGDLVPVEVEDRQHRSVVDRVQEAHALPRAFERSGLGLAVTDHRDHDEIGVVERRAERVREHVAELAAFVARNAAGRRELAEQRAHAAEIGGHVGIDLGVGPLEIDVGEHRGTAVARAGEEDRVETARHDCPIQVHVDQAQPG